jgi:hypothetical protein
VCGRLWGEFGQKTCLFVVVCRNPDVELCGETGLVKTSLEEWSNRLVVVVDGTSLFCR